jgi:hypothetical protein
MYLINADVIAEPVFNYTINNLCINTRYELSAYVANLLVPSYNGINPNITFEVRDDTIGNILLASTVTGYIPKYQNLTWAEYGLSFVTPVSSVILFMITDNAGGNGNDFVVDDIVLRSCSNAQPSICVP